VNRVAGALGAEIHGIDPTVPQADAAIATVRTLLLEYGVIFFRGQRLNDTTLKAFAGRFWHLFPPSLFRARRRPRHNRHSPRSGR
jgi:taurine dioxygenase